MKIQVIIQGGKISARLTTSVNELKEHQQKAMLESKDGEENPVIEITQVVVDNEFKSKFQEQGEPLDMD